MAKRGLSSRRPSNCCAALLLFHFSFHSRQWNLPSAFCHSGWRSQLISHSFTWLSPNAKTLLALFCLAPSGKLMTESIMFSMQQDWFNALVCICCPLTLHTLVSPSSLLTSPRGPGLSVCTIQGVELRALVNAPWEKINFSWMSPWCLKRQAEGGRVVCFQQPTTKTLISHKTTMQIHQDLFLVDLKLFSV